MANRDELRARLRIIATDYEPGSILRKTIEDVIATLAEGWVNCGKCRSPGSCGLTENCFGGYKDNG